METVNEEFKDYMKKKDLLKKNAIPLVLIGIYNLQSLSLSNESDAFMLSSVKSQL